MKPLARHTQKRTSYQEKAVIEWQVTDLLAWIKHKEPYQLSDDESTMLERARVSGKVFLAYAGNEEFFENKCKLSIGTAVVLAMLSSELAEQEGKRDRQQAEDGNVFDTTDMKKQLAQVAGQKRKGDGELNLPGTLEKSPKRKRNSQEDQDNYARVDDYENDEDAVLEKLSKRSRINKRLIRQEIEKLSAEHPINRTSCSDQPYSKFDLPGAVYSLSNPEYEHSLLFPIIPPVMPTRFEYNDNYRWRFVGREKFRSLLEEVNKMEDDKGSNCLWVYGTRGYGKSHLLAALVCYLTAIGETVLYIPDCRPLLQSPATCLRAAMLMAWSDEATQRHICKLDTTLEIRKFLVKNRALLVIDQMNALTNDNSPEKEEVTRLIDTLIVGRKAIFSSSANNFDYLRWHIKQHNEHILNVYGGLTEKEKEQWWKRHHNLDLGRYTRADIEDLTGNIPLLLNKCLQSGKLDMSPLREVAAKAVYFIRNIRKTVQRDDVDSDWKLFCEFVQDCLLNRPITPEEFRMNRLIDRRFFFEEDGIGRYSCGVVRQAVTNSLTKYQEYFLNERFLEALPTFYNNPSTLGFFMEYGVLHYLHLHGIPGQDPLANSISVVNFKGDYPLIKKDAIGKATLYHPEAFNYPTLDGFIVYLMPQESQENAIEKVLLYPYQVTLRRQSHKDSHAEFFQNYNKWIKGLHLEEYSVTVQFLWFTDGYDEFETNELQPASGGKKLRCGRVAGGNSEIPRHECRVISFAALDQKLGDKYEEVKRKANEEKIYKYAANGVQEEAEEVQEETEEKAQEVEEEAEEVQGEPEENPQEAEEEAAPRAPPVNSTRGTINSTGRIGTRSTAKSTRGNTRGRTTRSTRKGRKERR